MEKSQQNNKQWRSAGTYLIKLLWYALHDQQPEKKPEECIWQQVWMLAKRNNVECTVSSVIDRVTEEMPEKIWKSWKEARNRNLYRQVCFDIEKERITMKMAECGIASLPLKGILVSDYYPAPGMRWMCDNDILYGYIEPESNSGFKLKGNGLSEQEYWQEQAQKKLCEIMKKQGYMVESLKGPHDVYHKKPFFNFEMHKRIVSEDSKFAVYYTNPWKRAITIEGSPLQFRFSDEDEYLFLIAHAYKHFDASGCGIRTLVDEYVILQAKKKLDWEYINRELEQIGLIDFEKKLRNTAVHAFGENNQLHKEDWQIIFYMLGCGTYGTSANRVRRELQKLEETNAESVKQRYLKERFWIDEKRMKEFFPFFYRHSKLRLILPLYRLVKGLLVHPRYLMDEWKVLKQYISKKE